MGKIKQNELDCRDKDPLSSVDETLKLRSFGIKDEVNPVNDVDDGKCQRKQNSTAAVNNLHVEVMLRE